MQGSTVCRLWIVCLYCPQVTMPTMAPPPAPGEKAPPTRAFGAFQALRHVNGDPFDPYSRCSREWGG